MTTRRDFIKQSAVLGIAANAPACMSALQELSDNMPICIFSKHLQFLPTYEAAAEVAAEIGFDGVDLAVRPGGHVLPENVGADLPKAVGAMKAAGLQVPMMTTRIENVDSPHTKETLAIASGLGIHYYRMGYLKYDWEKGVQKTLSELAAPMEKLVALNQSYGLHGAYQNHDGRNIGAAIWDIWQLVQPHDPRWIGIQYDIRHAMVEGGKSWEVDLNLVKSHIKTLVIKDFHWAKDAKGRWYVKNVPIGEGMVDFATYFSLLKKYGIQVPISMHVEYTHFEEGDSLEVKRNKTTEAFKKDLTRLRKIIKDHYR